MKHRVKIMADGHSNEVLVEAETYEQAVAKLLDEFSCKNEAGILMSEVVVIYDGSGYPAHTIHNILCG